MAWWALSSLSLSCLCNFQWLYAEDYSSFFPDYPEDVLGRPFLNLYLFVFPPEKFSPATLAKGRSSKFSVRTSLYCLRLILH